MRLFVLTFLVSAAVWTLTLSASTPSDRAVASAKAGEWVLQPQLQDWAVLSSQAFFKKPTTLLEHRTVEGLRGIISRRSNALKKGQNFNESTRLAEVCRHIPATYAATRGRVVVQAKVVGGKTPHCRIRVEEGGERIEQILFVSQSRKRARITTTHTVTFFYPAEQQEAPAAITKFVAAVRRGDG